MNHTRSLPQAALAAVLTLLVLGTGLVPDFLDREMELRTTLESPHDAADCPGAHDHRVCAQINGSPRASSPARTATPPHGGVAWSLAPRLEGPSAETAPAHHPARAPPV